MYNDDDHKGIANLLALPFRKKPEPPKVTTKEFPSLSVSESLMNMRPLVLPTSETKDDHRYNDKNPRHRREVLKWMTRPEPKIKETPKETWNRLAKHGAEQSQKKIGNAPPGSKQQKFDMVKHIEKMTKMYDGPTVSDQPILKDNIKYVGNRSDNPSWMKDIEKTGPYGKNKRFVNKTLNKFENRTDNKDVVTFDPTTQLFTDDTRNIAFKSYDQAKRWNDAINGQPTATGQQVNDLKARLDNARAYGYDPEDKKEVRKNEVNKPKNPHRRLI